jgi:hypothetical protein
VNHKQKLPRLQKRLNHQKLPRLQKLPKKSLRKKGVYLVIPDQNLHDADQEAVEVVEDPKSVKAKILIKVLYFK